MSRSLLQTCIDNNYCCDTCGRRYMANYYDHGEIGYCSRFLDPCFRCIDEIIEEDFENPINNKGVCLGYIPKQEETANE